MKNKIREIITFMKMMWNNTSKPFPIMPATGNTVAITTNATTSTQSKPSRVDGNSPKKLKTEDLGIDFLEQNYEFRYNQMTDETEYRAFASDSENNFKIVTQRDLNSFCMAARGAGANCWDRDISRYIYSNKIRSYHPFTDYIQNLPIWDGKDRITDLAIRVSDLPLWINSFHRWMLGMVAQWMGVTGNHANCMAPILISLQQGRRKSTFCKALMPDCLQRYYTDSFDLNAQGRAEQKLTLFGLINLDEFDKFSVVKMSLLKNLMQMADLNLRMAYKKNYSSLPRIASFIGTSNRRDVLTDPTGSRRFLCVEVERIIDCSDIIHKQIYAQLVAELQQGERYWFTSSEEEAIMQNNKRFYRNSPEEDVFYSCFRVATVEDEAYQMLSGADIFNILKKYNPAAMRGVSATTFWKVLVAAGVTRIHTKKGNKYKVIPLQNAITVKG